MPITSTHIGAATLKSQRPDQRQKHQIKALTGLRGAAAVAVMLCHFSGHIQKAFHLPDLAKWVMASGWVAVDLFFIMSGFVMVHAHRAGAQTLHDYGRFLQKRLARIYPVHIITLVAAIAIVGAPDWWKPLPGLYDYARTALLVGSWWNYTHPIWNGVNWSLSAEWGAYVLFPLLFMLSRLERATAVRWAVTTALATTAVHMVFANRNMGIVIECALLRSVPDFAVGVMLYRMREFGVWRDNAAKLVNWSVVAILAVVFATGLLGQFKPLLWALVPPMALLVYGLSYSQGRVAAFMASPVMNWLGAVSFSIYMLHYVVLQAGRTPDQIAAMPGLSGMMFVAAQLVGTILLAWASNQWLETPMQRKFAPTSAARVGLCS